MSTDCFTIFATIFGFILTIIGFIITVVSWYEQSELNRKNEIAKVALKHRLELLRKTYNSVIQIYTILKKTTALLIHQQKQSRTM